MKIKLLTMLMLFSTIVFSQETINIKGYGEIPATKNGDKYTLNLGKLGTYDCSGSLKPLDLKVETTIEQLTEFPGYKILSNLGLTDISLEFNSEGLKIAANASTEQKLGPLCKLLKISTPTVGIEMKVSKKSFELEGELAFSKEPIKLITIDKTGTEIKFYSAGLGAAAEMGSVAITVSTKFLIKPTRFDPDLEVSYEFGYDLMTSEFSGTGSMMTNWVDPFGIADLGFVKKNSIILENAAVAMSITVLPPPATPTITNVGFAIERAKFFNLDFGAAVSIAPLDKQIVIQANRNGKMTMNDLTILLREGFGLKVKDIFPKDFYLENPEIKFAPTDAEIGEVEIEKGFSLSGVAKMSNLMTGELDFHCDLKNEFKLKIDFKSKLNEEILKNLTIVKKELGVEIPNFENLLKQFDIKRIYLELYANKTEKVMSGKGYANFTFKGKQYQPEFDATLDPKEIAKKILLKVIPSMINFDKLIANATKNSMKLASQGWSSAEKLVNDAKTITKHIHGNPLTSYKTCDKECVPNHAAKLSKPLITSSNNAIQKFYDEVMPSLKLLKGKNAAETSELRYNYIIDKWEDITAKIDHDWDKIIYDRTYVRYYITQDHAENGGKIYRKKVRAYKASHVAFRERIWRKMVSVNPKSPTRKLKGVKVPEGIYYIQSAMSYESHSKNGYLQFPGKTPDWYRKGNKMSIWNLDSNPNKKFYFKKRKDRAYYTILSGEEKYRGLAIDLESGKTIKGTPLHGWSPHYHDSQQFYLKHMGNGKFKIYHKSGMIVCLQHSDNKNDNKVHLWNDHTKGTTQWYLINAKTSKKFVP